MIAEMTRDIESPEQVLPEHFGNVPPGVREVIEVYSRIAIVLQQAGVYTDPGLRAVSFVSDRTA
jgi:hypothetical protein